MAQARQEHVDDGQEKSPPSSSSSPVDRDALFHIAQNHASSSDPMTPEPSQIQPVLHNSLLYSSLGEEREFITGIHSQGLVKQSSSDDTTKSNNRPIDGKTLPNGEIPENFRSYLMKKIDSTNDVGVGSRNNSSQFLESLSSSNLKSVKSHAQLAKTAQGVRILAKNLSKARIKLQLKSVMIVTKARDNSLIYLTRELAEWLLQKNQIDVYVDYHLEHSKRFNAEGLIKDYLHCRNRLKYWTKSMIQTDPDLFDLVLTLGGDGTVLYVSTLFQRVVPPVMSFSLGSLGFLTNFDFENFRPLLDQVLRKGVKTNLRMRLTCRVHKAGGDLVCEQQVLNEIVIDRGPSPWVSMLELYGDGSLLTVAQADGLILATPTGSTAYSLSAGGSLVHPGVTAISVTPICPHTLSFRPILLPDSMTLTIKVPMRSRSNAWCSFDGRSRIELQKGDYVTVVASPFPFPTVRSSKTEFIDSVSRILNWNVREEQKSFVHLLSDKNKQAFDKHLNEKRHRGGPRQTAMFQVTEDDEGEPHEEDEEEEDFENESINSMDYHQAFFDDNDKFNTSEVKDGKPTAEEDKFDIDYSDGEQEKKKHEDHAKYPQSKTYRVSDLKSEMNGGSTSSLEIDDTKDYIPGRVYKPRPEDEIHTPALEKELPLLDQVEANQSLQASQIITDELLDNLSKLGKDNDN